MKQKNIITGTLGLALPFFMFGMNSGVYAMAANCAPVEVRWGSADECKVLSTEVADGDSKVLISPPRREANKFVGVGSATFKCEIGKLTYVSGSCGNMVDSYSSQRVSTLPTAQTAPTVASSTELSPVRSQNTFKSSSVTQLTNEVGAWESQLSKDMKAQEARMVAYTDTKHSEAKSYTDTKATQTLNSANSYTNTKSAETLTSANSYANTRANQALASANSYTDNKANQTLASANSYTDSKATQTLNSANSYTNSKSTETLNSANSYTDTKANQTLASANSYTDSKATATLNSANSYTNSKSTETLNSANSYTNTKSTQTLNSANAYTDSKATATLNSANTYTNNSSATTLANSKSYTDSKSASTLTAANNYTDQEVASVAGQQQGSTDGPAKAWTLSFVGQCLTSNAGDPWSSYGTTSTGCVLADGTIRTTAPAEASNPNRILYNGRYYMLIPKPVGYDPVASSQSTRGNCESLTTSARPIVDNSGNYTGWVYTHASSPNVCYN